MSSVKKGWLIAAAVLVVGGLLMVGGAVYFCDLDFHQFNTLKYEMHSTDIDPEFEQIDIDTSVAAVSIELSPDGNCRLDCYEPSKMKHSAQVENGVLKIREVQKWEGGFGIDMEEPTLTLYLPKDQYAALKLMVDTGDIRVPKIFTFDRVQIGSDTGDVDFQAGVTGQAQFKTDTGTVKAAGVSCGNFTAESDTGEILLENVIASGTLDVTSQTGDVRLKECDGAEIYITTDTGDVKGTILTEKVFLTETDTGEVNVPKSLTGGRCEITTQTGDIDIMIAQ